MHNLAAAHTFYGDILQCREERSCEKWVDFDLYEYQIVARFSEQSRGHFTTNPVNGYDVLAPHIGVILIMSQWGELPNRLRKTKVQFVNEP